MSDPEDEQLPEISQGGTDQPAPLSDGVVLSPGDTLDDFEIIEEVGRGGMGVVYKAFERSLRRVVALKVLNPAISGDPSLAKRFRREAILAANLSHPNIVPVYHVDHGERPRYFTMEYVQGRSLKEKIEKDGFLGPAEALRVAIQTCEALHYAHERSIIHRDVKPANILLQNHVERVRITDFGIAQDVTGQLAERTETSGFTAGTPAFMSPEQNLGRDLDCRTDVFSFGMTLYYMLTGQVAYHANNRAELALAFRQQAPVPPSRLNPEVGSDLDRVVLRMIAVDPQDRYSDCKAVAEALRSARPSVHGAAVAERKRPSPVRVLLICAVAMSAIAGAALAWRGARLSSRGGTGSPQTTPLSGEASEQASPQSAALNSAHELFQPNGKKDYLREFPATFSGWANMPESAGRFVSDGRSIRLPDWTTGGTVAAEKPLSQPVGPGDDFALMVDLEAPDDVAGRAGWFAVTLLDDAGEVVAAATWFDEQDGIGYGGVAFHAEGQTLLYRSQPVGQAKDHPTIRGILKVIRSGSQWQAFVNDTPKGPLVSLRATRTATRVRLEAGCSPGTVPRHIEMTGLFVAGIGQDAVQKP